MSGPFLTSDHVLYAAGILAGAVVAAVAAAAVVAWRWGR